jgi:sirohydrochlorin cobaltochelatase
MASIENSAPIGVLLVAHGTRSELGRKQCRALADEIAAGLNERVVATELAFLELAEPTIEASVSRLVEQKIGRLVVAPFLLFAAAHAKEDIPATVRSALVAAGVPQLPLVQTEPLGLQESILDLATERFLDAADPRIAPADTCLLLIGRGSRDKEATADMRKFGELLHQRLGLGQTQVGFLAMAQPSAQDLISAVAKSNSSAINQIIIQPHLLFHGELLERLKSYVSEVSASVPERAWRISPVLGEETSSLARILLQGICLDGNIM